MPARVRASDDDEESQLLNNKKSSKLHGYANYDLLRLRDMERFIFKFYFARFFFERLFQL